MNDLPASKACTQCGTETELALFSKDVRARDGRKSACKACDRRYHHVYRRDNKAKIRDSAAKSYLKNRDRILKKHSAYNKLPSNQAAIALARQKYRQTHPVEHEAHQQVNHAIATGKLTRPDACSMCDKVGRVQGHHADYTKPLLVAWVCKECHNKIHREMNAIKRASS